MISPATLKTTATVDLHEIKIRFRTCHGEEKIIILSATSFFQTRIVYTKKSSTTPKLLQINSFFPHKGRLWNSLPIECFPLIYNLSGFKSRFCKNQADLAYLK